MSKPNNDHSIPTSMLEEGAQQFKALKKSSGEVEALFKQSVRLEARLSKLLAKFIRASLLALRAARALVTTIPSDSQLLEYIQTLVNDSFEEVSQELSEQPEEK